MSDRLVLPMRYLREVERILQMVVPDVEVWAYGSRVTGTAYEASDLDLVLRPPGREPRQGNWERSYRRFRSRISRSSSTSMTGL